VVDGQLRQKWEALSKKKHTKRKKKDWIVAQVVECLTSSSS
jgi:hypothetical protein